MGCTAKMCDSFQTVWHEALQSALQMVLLFTLSASFFSPPLFLFLIFFHKMLWLSLPPTPPFFYIFFGE